MTCRDFVSFLISYWSGELLPQERERFERHLAECPSCVAYLTTYDAAIRLSRSALAPAARVPADVPEELVQAILASRHPN